MTIRIAMWSGPRNLSTAMMRSFGSRADTAVVDEPFYAAYLRITGEDHPMREDVLKAHEDDPGVVAASLCGDAIGTPIFYQKQMTHHMVEGIPRDWFGSCRHAFLIRHPARVIASYLNKRETVSADDIGFHQQADLFQEISHTTAEEPVVVDSDDILSDPAAMLPKLCAALGIPFNEAMLSWEPGPKPEDGAWAPHWYDAVNRSAGFGESPGPLPELPTKHGPLLKQTLPLYERLKAKAVH